ncbi:MAG: TlpA family protein disulfide reductase [Ideonella sp.]|nr:TlpA family protein disulfide reductase [Ideonella sp.]MCC7456561.1 TlpA family protein disulfide reductase [Nitrospira sp.]
MTAARRRIVGAAVGAAAAVAGAGVAYRWYSARDGAPATAIWDLQFERPNGGKLVMANLFGKRLILNFWATWCAPCIRELPALQRFQRDYATHGWQVVALAVDQPVPVLEFIARFKLELTVAMAGIEGMQWQREAGNPSGGLPFSVMLDASGRLRQRRLGESRYEDLVRWATDA